MNPVIRIHKGWARLSGASGRVLQECLEPLDPKRFYNKAFVQKWWDGREPLYDGLDFPAGLIPVVEKWFEARDVYVTVHRKDTREPDLSIIDSTYLGKIGPDFAFDLWDHQVDAALALLRAGASKGGGIARVTTGGGKTFLIAVLAKYYWETYGWRTLVIVSKRGLARQTSTVLRDTYRGHLLVGQCGDGQKTIETVTVATASTLMQYKDHERKVRGKKHKKVIPGNDDLRYMIENYEVMILDEAHHASATTWYDIAMRSGAIRRFGVSGTPLQDQELYDMKLIGATGELVFDVDTQELIADGLSAQPKIAIVMSDNASEPELPLVWITKKTPAGNLLRQQVVMGYQKAYDTGVVYSEIHNIAVLQAVKWLIRKGRSVLVMCRRKDHFRLLSELFALEGLNAMQLWGATATSDRDLVKDAIRGGGVDVVLVSTVWDEGEDVPAIDAIVLAEGVKSLVNVLQRIGRGMRAKHDGGDNDVWIVDFAPTCHHKLLEHAMIRAETYERVGYPSKVVTKWPSEDEGVPDDLLPFEDWNVPVRR